MQIITIGLDIAKNIFQVHAIDEHEKVVVRKQLRRGQVIRFFEELPPCLVGLSERLRTSSMSALFELPDPYLATAHSARQQPIDIPRRVRSGVFLV